MSFHAPRSTSARFVVWRGPFRSSTSFSSGSFAVRWRSFHAVSPTCSRAARTSLVSSTSSHVLAPPCSSRARFDASSFARGVLRTFRPSQFVPRARQNGGAKVQEDRVFRQERPGAIQSCRVRREASETRRRSARKRREMRASMEWRDLRGRGNRPPFLERTRSRRGRRTRVPAGMGGSEGHVRARRRVSAPGFGRPVPPRVKFVRGKPMVDRSSQRWRFDGVRGGGDLGRRRDASRTHLRGKSPRTNRVSGEKDDRTASVSWEDLDHALSRIVSQGTPRHSPPRTCYPLVPFVSFLRGLWSPSAGTWAPGRLGTGCRRGVDSSVSCTCADPTRETVHGPERRTVHTVLQGAHRALVSMRCPSLLGAVGSKRCDSRRVVEDQPRRNMATYHAVVGRMLETHSIRIAVVVLLMELVLHVFSKSLVRRGPSRSVAARVRRGNAETELTRTRTARDRHWDPPGRSRS